MRKGKVIAMAASAVIAGFHVDAMAGNATWQQTSGGPYSWVTDANWLPAAHPDGAGQIASFTGLNYTAAQTVTLDSNTITVGQLNIADSATAFFPVNISSGTTVAGTFAANTLVFDNGTSSATLNNSGGTSTANDLISTPISLNSNLSIVASTGAAGTFTLSGVIADGTASHGLLATGAASTTGGTVVISGTANTYTGTTTVDNGTLTFSGNLDPSVPTALGNAASAVVIGSPTSPATNVTLNVLATTASSANEISRTLDFSGDNTNASGTGNTQLVYSPSGSAPFSNVLTENGSIIVGTKRAMVTTAARVGMQIVFNGLITGGGGSPGAGDGNVDTWNIGSTPNGSDGSGTSSYVFNNVNNNFSDNLYLPAGIVYVAGSVPASPTADSALGHNGQNSSGVVGTAGISMTVGSGGDIISYDGQTNIRGLYLTTPNAIFARSENPGAGSAATSTAKYGAGSVSVVGGFQFGSNASSGETTWSGYITPGTVAAGSTGGTATYSTIPITGNIALISATGGSVNFTGGVGGVTDVNTVNATQSQNNRVRITINGARNNPYLDTNADGLVDAAANAIIPGSVTAGVVKLNNAGSSDFWYGTTEVMGGTALLNSYIGYNFGTSSSEGDTWTVDSGATLGGYGHLFAGLTGSVVNVAGGITPGDHTATTVTTASILTIDKQVNFLAGSNFTVNLNGAINVTANPSTVASADQLHVTSAGGVTLDDTSLATEPLLNVNLGFTPLENQGFKIIDLDGTATYNTSAGAVGGTFATLTGTTRTALTQLSTFTKTYGGKTYTFTASYTTGSGNDLSLVTTGPSGWIVDSDGDFGTASNWDDGVPAYTGIASTGITANFGNVATAIRNVGVSTFYGTGLIVFNDTNPGAGYNLTNTGSGFLGVQGINAINGYAAIGVGISLSGAINVSNAAQLSISGNIGGGATINVSNTAVLTLSGTNTFNGGTVNVSGGSLLLASNHAFPTNSSLIIGSAGSVAAQNVSSGIYGVGFKTLSNAGLLDLQSNAAVIHTGSTVASITTQINAAFNNGSWNGASGITSSAAAADTSHLTAIGVIINDTGSNSGASTGTPLYTSLDGATTVDGDILLKTTYYGDANLSGAVDGSDYSLIDNGFLNQLTGWFNGDFNYDGVINGSDYTLIDNAFNTQGASLAAVIASPTAQIAGGLGASAVPEPTTLGILGMSAAGLLGRRRRRSSIWLAGAH